ncbi:hypothetical protein BSL82_03760 [Tardibacter chloracetimidivorans]|uniref:Uncharacterized protein n=1 Tax=Tardibacter chloracetimidivorans TaxID=1921510 RepID=A0A1L3ZSD4_9SPHN|nr:hypothetical protein BSL82_03760 [Tardibacter chloracetimidivorans]
METQSVASTPAPGAQGSAALSISQEVRRSYNNANPGLYARCNSGIQVGGYYNSERNFTAYASYVKDLRIVGPVSAWGAVGLATGYERHRITPIALVGGKLDLGDRLALRVGYAPKVAKANDTHLVHFALEWRLGR